MMLAVSVALPQPNLAGSGGGPPAPPALAVIATGSDAGSSSLFEPSFEVPVSTHLLLEAHLVWNEDLGELAPAPAASYNGVPMTLLPNSLRVAGTAQAAIFYLVAPATGLHDFNFEFDIPVKYRGVFVVRRGVDQVTPFGSSGGAGGTGTAVSVTVSPAPASSSHLMDHLLVDLVGATTSASRHASQTEIDNTLVGVSPFHMRQGVSWKTGGGATMSWTLAASKPWATFAHEIRQAT